MRRPLTLPAVAVAALVAAVLAPAAPALAHPLEGLAPTLPTDLTHSRTPNIDYLGRFPEHFGTAGGVLRPDGKVFFITDPRGVYAYDVSKPESPTLLGSTAVYQHSSGTGAALGQEDPDTDGRVLLVDGNPSPTATGSALQVVDVSNPAALTITGTFPGVEHTWECVSGTDKAGVARGCAYAYGRSGRILDLRDPSKPVLVATNWKTATQYPDYAHDLTEVRPGLVMSAGAQAVLMDTRIPTSPKKLAVLGTKSRFPSLGYHSVEWANGGRDPFVVVGTEISPGPGTGGAGAGSDCEGEASVIETWDAREILVGLQALEAGAPASAAFAGKAFKKIQSYDAGSRGLFVTGAAPGNVLYCAHWMELHPDFDGGGLMAVSYYDRGTRFVEVATDGTMKEVGWITAAESYSGSVQWISKDIAYIMDYRRGMEVVRVRSTPATGVVRSAGDLVAATSGWTPPTGMPGAGAAGLVAGALGLLVLAAVARRRQDALVAA